MKKPATRAFFLPLTRLAQADKTELLFQNESRVMDASEADHVW